LWPNGWMDQDAIWYRSRPQPGHIVLMRTQLSPQKGAQQPRSFQSMSIVAKLSSISGTAELVTSPTRAVAKYCDEYVCLCVCLSVCEDISGTTRAIFTKFLCMLPISVARSSYGKYDDRQHRLSAGTG